MFKSENYKMPKPANYVVEEKSEVVKNDHGVHHVTEIKVFHPNNLKESVGTALVQIRVSDQKSSSGLSKVLHFEADKPRVAYLLHENLIKRLNELKVSSDHVVEIPFRVISGLASKVIPWPGTESQFSSRKKMDLDVQRKFKDMPYSWTPYPRFETNYETYKALFSNEIHRLRRNSLNFTLDGPLNDFSDLERESGKILARMILNTDRKTKPILSHSEIPSAFNALKDKTTDQRHLVIWHLRAQGYSTAEIARATGIRPLGVRNIIEELQK